MVVSRLMCEDILAKYPKTQTAINEAELHTKLNQRLKDMANERICAQFKDSNY